MVLISKTDFKFFPSISEMANFKGMTKGRRITFFSVKISLLLVSGVEGTPSESSTSQL